MLVLPTEAQKLAVQGDVLLGHHAYLIAQLGHAVLKKALSSDEVKVLNVDWRPGYAVWTAATSAVPTVVTAIAPCSASQWCWSWRGAACPLRLTGWRRFHVGSCGAASIADVIPSRQAASRRQLPRGDVA